MGCEKRRVRIGKTVLGAGMPKICIPVMGKTLEEIAQGAQRAKEAQADVIELRIDSLCPAPASELAIAACRAVREHAPDTALLFTLRTMRDGGAGTGDAAAYEALLLDVCMAQAAEAIDCELSVGEDTFARITDAAHACGVAVVGSSHEFGEIGDMARAANWLRAQSALCADVCKAAVMAHSGSEALHAAYVMAQAGEEIPQPIVAIAMGDFGVITRAGAQALGSCLTFATAGQASAPGQMDARELRDVLEALHRAM